MGLFHNAKAVRLRSHHDKFLIAEEDEESVTQDRNGSSKNAKWTVEPVPGSQNIIRLKSCYGKYLTASNQPFLLGMTGRKVTQSLPRRLDSSVEWEPVREANQVKLKTRYGHFLRANMGLPPWRNSVTHDIPHRTATQDWILWDVHVVEIQVQSPRGQQEAQPPPTIPHSDSLDFDSSSPFSVSINSGKFSRQESNDSDVGSPPKSEGRTIYYHMADESGEVDDDSLQGFAMTFKGNGVDELTQKLREELGIQDLFVCTRSPLNGKLYPVRLQLPPITADMHVIVVPSSSNAYGCSYESKKRRDWNTFLQYIKNQRPPLTLERCSGAHVIEYLRYLDQFGKTKVHVTGCLFFGIPDPPAPCYCPLRQSWGSLDALIGRLRAAYEENGGLPESNPFGCRDVRIFLNEVRKHQAEARGIPYDKKESSAAERKKKNRQDKAVPIPYYEKEKASTAMSVGEGSGTGPAAGSGSREASENAAAATTTTKLEHVSFSNEDKLASVFDEVCDRLDSDASVFWSHKDLKQLRLKLAQVYDFLGHSKRCPFDQNVLNLWLSDLKSLPCDVDDLLDDWEQLEISRLKFNQEVRRIHEWLVRFLNLFQKLVTGHYEDRSAIPELSSARSDEYTIFERDLERSIDSVKHVLLLDVNVVRIITILGVSGIGKTVLAQRIYSDGKVKSHFPLRFWFKVDMNLEFSTVVKAIEIRCCEIRVAEKMLSKRLLIVLDNVCDLDDEKLDKFRLLISDIRDSGSCVMVTTRSDHVATTMRTVPAQHFSYFPESDSLSNFNLEILPALQAHSHGLGHGKDLILEAMTEGQRNFESATDEDPELSPGDEISCPPPMGMLDGHESKIQLASFETGELAVQFPGMMATLERNVQRIFRCVTDVTALKIGVHGVGGIGKTAALRALICFPEIKGLFDIVILVTVSRYWNTRKIQNEVLKQLSLRPEDYETDSEVAERLLQILNGKKFLLLLDDVWEQIDLNSMGIPVPSAENGCKILMASRKLDVCHNMNVSKVIELESLSWKEAWQLFYKQVGGIVQSPAIRPFARAIVKGCNGLPLLIIVTGKALVEENNDCTWEHASKKFSPPGTARVYQTEDVIHLLKFSFDQLKDDDIKSCFLYCGLFSEDQEVNIYGLIEYCFQEGIINGAHADAHKRGCDIIDVLVKASLVKVTKDNDSIKMHGLIRDLALGIISSSAEHDAQSLLSAEGSQFLLRAYSRLVEPPNTSNSSSSSLESPKRRKMFIPEAHQFLLGAHAGLTEPPSEEEWKCAKMIFLMDNELYTLPQRPSCPNLLTLFLQRNCRLRVIPPSFFELMTSLKVLNLSKTSIKSLPKTLVYLKRLQILILRDCELLLVLPSEVGSLECLEVLDLGGTEINKLPDEIVKLASLRYLNVFFYGCIDKSENIKLPCHLISGGTLSGLQALETLSIVVYPGDKIEYVAEFLKESVAWKDQQLTEFKFVVGHDVKSIVSRVADYVQFDYNQQDRCLRFVNGKSISTEVLQILGRCTAFYVDHHLVIDSLSNFGDSNMDGLKLCIISECPGIKTVVDIKEHTSTAVFPSLENLTVNYLWNLTCIWEGIVPEGSFAELRILSVHACQQLEYVFTSSMVRFLSKLEELTVEHCPAIKSIILDGEIIDSSCIMLPSLKKLRLHYLPELVYIWSNDWPSLEYISFYGCPKLKKIGMDPKLKDTLTWIKAEKKWWAELDWEDTELPIHLEDRLSTFSCSFSEDNEDQEP